jgi:hypothetical protein
MNRIILMMIVVQLPLPVRADVQEFLDKAWWETTSQEFTTIPFTEYYPPSQIIFDQFEDLGVVFAGEGSTHYTSYAETALDDVYLNATNGGPFPWNAPISLGFTEPHFTIGVEYPGRIQVFLYRGKQLIYSSNLVHPPGQSLSAFFGLVSSESFDRVLLWDPYGGSTIDTLLFGSFAPARGACCVFDGSCSDSVLEFSCLAQRGIYLGAGSTCEAPCPPICQGDLDDDGSVDIDDLLEVINHWGGCPYPCPLPCPGDIVPNCWVNIDDLLVIVNAWGQCQ